MDASGLVSRICRLLGFEILLRACAGIARFAWSWLRTRRLTQLLPGLIPLTVAAIAILAVLADRIPDHRSRLLESYLNRGRANVTSGDVAAARLAYRRATDLSGGSNDVRFEFASALHQMGEVHESYRIMSGMAPLRKTGYLPAHRFLATHFQVNDELATQVVRICHLAHVVRQSRDNRTDRQELYFRLVRLRQFTAAEKLLRETVNEYPEDRLQLVQLKAAMDDEQNAIVEARYAVEHFSVALASDESNIDRRIQLAQSYVYLGQFGRALIVLRDAPGSSPDKRLPEAIAGTCSQWMSLLDVNQRKAQFQCLLQLIQYDNKQPPTDNITLQEFFQEVLRSDRGDMFLSFLAGTIAAHEGRLDESVQLLRDADRMNPLNPTIQNNLACVLLERARVVVTNGEQTGNQNDAARPADSLTIKLAEALQLADQAIAAMSHVAEFHDTRAQILAMMGQYEECVRELRTCLSLGLREARIHRQLARHLQTLGRTAEALEHADLEKQLSPVGKD